MDALLAPPALPRTATPSPPRAAAKRCPIAVRLLAGLARGLKCWLLAAFACLSLPLAIVFSGWTYRLVQHRACRLWAKRLGSPEPGRTLPRWLLSERFREELACASHGPFRQRLRHLRRALTSSLAANLRTGFLAVLNSTLVTLPGGLLMLFSWYAGWDNSFNKGYEQAQAGPLWGLAGIALFMAAMTYVPLAQARQAVTGRAKAFWNYRRVRDVIARRPLACLFLVAGYTALGFGFMIAVSALMFIGTADQFAEMSNAQIVAWLNSYHFWWAALFIAPGFVALKLVAGRIYAGAACEAVMDGRWRKDDLAGAEAAALAAAPVCGAPPPLPGLRRTSRRACSAIGRASMSTLTFFLLLLFAFQLYVAQFFAFEPAANWLRQPMVQLPWYHSIPAHLRE